MKHYIERYWCVVLAIILSILFYECQHNIEKVGEMISKLLEITLSLCATLLGFLLTILTIINTINTRRMNFVRDSGYLYTLNSYLKIALWMDLVTISLSFIFPLLQMVNNTQQAVSWYNLGVIFIVSYTLFSNIRFSIIFINLLTDPVKSK